MTIFSDSLIHGSEATAIQAGDLSFGQKALAAGAGAVISGLGSIYNTGVAAGNLVGLGAEEIKTADVLRSLDNNWAAYYQENQTAIDVVGFIGTALLPGTLAVKGLNLIRNGENVGAIGRSLNFFRTKQSEALGRATAELSQEGGSAFTRLNKNKLSMMGWETADQTLQAAVFELGVALTMKQSPLLADDGWWDITKGMATGAALGGVVGGGIGALGLNRAFKEAVKKIDETTNRYSAITGVDKLNLSDGDKAYAFLDAVSRVPAELLDRDKILELTFPLGSGPVSKKVDISSVLTNASRQSTKIALEQFETSLRSIVSKDSLTDVQQPFAEFVLRKYADLTAKGAPPSIIREELGDYLFNLKKVNAAIEEPSIRAQDLFYFRKHITPEELKSVKSIEDLRDLQVSTAPIGPQAQRYKNAFVYTGKDLAEERIAIIGRKEENGFPTLDAAWKNGYNVAINQDGSLAINQASTVWKKAVDPVFDSRRYLNTRTGALTDDTVLTAADRAVPGATLRLTETAVEVPLKDSTKRIQMTDAIPANADLTYATARHAWAGNLAEKAIPKVIKQEDISLLERLNTLDAAKRGEYEIVGPNGTVSSGSDVESILLQQKLQGLQKSFLEGTQDTRELAYRFNTTEAWIERAVGSEFGAALPDTSSLLKGMSRDLAEFSRRENLVAHYEHPHQFTALNALHRSMPWKQQRELILDQARANGGQFVTGELAYAYRVQQATKATDNASAAVLGFEKWNQLPDLRQDAARLANSLGAGATFLGASNASYGEVLKLASQNIGKFTHQWIQEASDDVAAAFSPVATKILNNKAAAAELGIVTNILRNESGKYVWEQAGFGLERLVRRELTGISDPAKRAAKEIELADAGERVFINIDRPEVVEFLKQHTSLNGSRVDKERVLINARGMTSNKDGAVVYAPPIDTNYFQHFAFVRPVDGKAFGTSEVAMIFGRDAAELQARIAKVDRTQFDVITKADGERYFKAKGDYDFDSTINDRNIDSNLRRSGALSNFFPETRAENLVEDYLRWHQNQAGKLVRNAVESKYAQQIEELRALGQNFQNYATSKFSGTLKAGKSEINNPYDDYIKTMLDVSKRSEYRLFQEANEFVDALGTRAYQILSDVTGRAQKGLLPWEEANKIAERHGIRGPYSSAEDYFLTNAPRDRNLAKEFVAKANTLLANLVLRFDFAQSLMNVVSTPLLLGTELASIRTLVRQDSELAGALRQLTSVAVPGTQGAAAVPSTMKLLSNAIANFHGPEKLQLLKRYRDNGDIKDTLALYQSAISDLALSPNFKTFSDGIERATEKVATLTGNNWSEEFTRFVSADVMRQLSDPLVQKGLLDVKTQNSYISTFVNRVQGNYISSQRPVVFQGVLGGAIGLFQTYSFNLLQQLLRHVENKDKRAVATLFGMQSGLFGLNGTPLFDAINTHIIGNAAVNDGHYDAYSIAPQLVGKEVGDWLMYGTVSAFPGFGDSWPALYTRGDINPRHMTILPLTPTQVPAIDASIRLVSNLIDVGSKLVGGADIGPTLLQGLEHNGINRPLAGIAQIAAGQSTTSRGGLISANSDFELIANASRILGAKPMDEAVALNNLYRIKAYQAADQDRMEKLGERVKTFLDKNQVPPPEVIEQFFADYTSIGGRPEHFNRALQRWMKDANVSVVEKMRSNINSPYGQRLNEIMGGVPLEDYQNQPVQEAPPAEMQ
jgi:hypothetical protein